MRCPPPRNFRPARDVQTAKLSPRPHFIKQSRPRGRKAEGLRYERKVGIYLEEHFEDRYVLGPWFEFTTAYSGSVFLHCQPDFLVFDIRRGTITVGEVKLKHTSDAWFQLRQLYVPVVRHVFGPTWDYRVVEVAKIFDPDTLFPEAYTLIRDINDVERRADNVFYVHVWWAKGVKLERQRKKRSR